MKNNRGQVTIFIIISILLIAVIGFFFFINTEEDSSANADTKNVVNSVKYCLENISKKALVEAESSGGIIYGKNEEQFLQGEVLYYNTKPMSVAIIESELALFIDKNLKDCTEKITDVRYTLTFKEPKTKIKIQDSFIDIETIFPVILRSEESSLEIKSFNSRIYTNISRFFNIAKELTNANLFNSTQLCFSCVQKISQEKNVHINIETLKEGTLLVISSDEKINNETEMFIFALK